MDIVISENKERKRFEAVVDGETARIEYIRAEDKMYLTHTEVPKALEGKGVASAMAKLVLHQIKDEGLFLVPLCPFIAAYLKRHPEWKEILAKGYHV
jgi:hypothetical protein